MIHTQIFFLILNSKSKNVHQLCVKRVTQIFWFFKKAGWLYARLYNETKMNACTLILLICLRLFWFSLTVLFKSVIVLLIFKEFLNVLISKRAVSMSPTKIVNPSIVLVKLGIIVVTISHTFQDYVVWYIYMIF